jgi:hypothetical protein
MSHSQSDIDKLKAEIEYYKKMITWYSDTYETRSIAGVVKDKLNKKIRNNLNFKRIIKNPSIKLKATNTARMPAVKSVDKSSFYSLHAMDEKMLKIGVFIHLYYHDIWPELNEYLSRLGLNFDLLITLNEEDKNSDAISKVIRKEYPSAIILKVPNRGLDIGPFFELTNYVISRNLKYDYVLKLHTKKSLGVDASVGQWWRKKCYESLMGSYGVASHILRLFITNPSIGMVGPYETRMSLTMNDLGQGGNANEKNIKHLAERLNIKDTRLDFFGGTMFWVRWSIYEEKFKKATMCCKDFEPGYKKDELLSHAMERLLASIVRDAGYDLYEMSKVNDYIFYKSRRKKICWVHPGFGIGGGNRIIFDICQEQMKYYDVYSISFMGMPFTNWMDVDHNVLLFSNPEEAKYFIETVGIDYVYATGWQTVDFVKSLPGSYKKFYFIQDYEPWFADANAALAKETYKNNFHGNIVYSEWLKVKLAKEHKLDATFIKCGAPEFNIRPGALPSGNPKRILLYFKLKNHRGRGADLIEELLKKLAKHKELEINVIGHEDPQVPGINFLGELHKDSLLQLYTKSDFFVDLSRHRGVATITMEIAQLGVVSLLSKKEYGLEEYGFEDGKNCVFVDGVEDAYKKLLKLSKDRKTYLEMRKNVIELGKTFRYKYTVNDFNQVMDVLS